MSTTHPTTLTDDDRAALRAFGVRTIYPVRITTDIFTRVGNVLAAEGEQTWGGHDGYGLGHGITIVTPRHYAGIRYSSICYGYRVDYDQPVTL